MIDGHLVHLVVASRQPVTAQEKLGSSNGAEAGVEVDLSAAVFEGGEIGGRGGGEGEDVAAGRKGVKLEGRRGRMMRAYMVTSPSAGFRA